MAATPLFLITDQGLAAASVATPTGPYIHITSFLVGSAYGYTPTREDPGINGNLLYQGVPTSYSYVGNNTIDILCQIPPDAGPFDFGEVALELDGGIMFAKAVFDTPQTKYSALGTNIISTYSFHCLLQLAQSVAVFQVDTASGLTPAVWEVDNWSDVYPPGISANPDIPLTLVRELNEYGDSSLLQNTNDSYWTLGTTSYNRYAAVGGSTTFPVVNASTTWIEVAASLCHPGDLTTVNRRFVIETADHYYRSVLSVVVSESNYRFNLNAAPLSAVPAVASRISIFRDDQKGGSIYYSQIIDPPTPYTLPIASSTVLGGIKVGANLSIAGDGTLSGAAPYTLPIATGGTLGGVKIGTGLTELGDGTISAQQYVLPIGSSGQLGGVKIGSGITEAGDGTISVAYSSLVPIGAGWSVLGSFTTNFSTTNATSHVQYYSFQGGNWVGGSGDNRTNPYSLNVSVNGLGVSFVADNDGDDHRVGMAYAMVPPGGTVSCLSTPFSAPGGGQFNVYMFTGLMV